ncbi:MAG: type II secretion system F family protein [Actinomycetota bacterium]|nr:type II secretion system F family protein [Actinomycetota bacterium]
MPVYVVLAALAVALSIPAFVYAVSLERAPVRRVTRNLTAGLADGGDLRGLVLSQSPLERIVQPLVRILARPARRLSPSGMVAALERRTELSGTAWPIERILAVKLALGGALGVGTLFWALRTGSAVNILAALAASAVGYLGPDTVLARSATSRQLAIANQLPDVLDQLSICVDAGLGFDAALTRIARTGQGPLAVEISRLLQELRMGVPRAEALENLLERTDVAELRQFVHAVSQAETYGVPITRVLRSQALEQREKRRFRAEERAMKLPVKVIFPLVFCILPTLFIVVLGPAFVHLTDIVK